MRIQAPRPMATSSGVRPSVGGRHRPHTKVYKNPFHRMLRLGLHESIREFASEKFDLMRAEATTRMSWLTIPYLESAFTLPFAFSLFFLFFSSIVSFGLLLFCAFS